MPQRYQTHTMLIKLSRASILAISKLFLKRKSKIVYWFVSVRYTAKDKRFLQRQGFTHVLNAAEGIDELQVNTNEYYYRDVKIKYMGIPGHDRPSWNIAVYFEQTAQFIDNALKNGGKVLVHCVVGISRSATLVIAYLIICRGMNAAEALTHVFKQRRVFPNMGFLHHLAELDVRVNSSRNGRIGRLYV